MESEELVEEFERQKRLALFNKVKAERLDTRSKDDQFDDKSTIDKVRGVIGSAQEGQLLGFGDEIAGAGRTALDYLAPSSWGEGTQSLTDKYKMYRDDERQNTKEFADANPKTSLALNLAGGLATPIKGPKGLPKSTGTAAKQKDIAQQAIARGVSEGAVAGVGVSEADNLEDMAYDALEGGAWGGGTTIGLRGLGKAASVVAKKRVAEDLVDAAGRRKPLTMVDEPIAEAYRSVARVPGARGRIVDLEQPFIEDAQSAIYRADEGLRKTKAAALSRQDLLKEQDIIRGQNIVDDLDVRANAAIEDAKSVPGKVAKKEAAKFRSDAAKQALPPHAQNILDNVDTANDITTVRGKLSNWWQNNGFREVKDNFFDFDDTLSRNIKARMQDDADLRLALGDLTPQLKKMQAKLTDVQQPGSDLIPEDYIDDLLSGKYQISGDALMAMRNVFATGANGSSKNKYALRQVANVFDDFIRTNLDEIDPALTKQFNDQLKQYTTALTYMGASGSKAARENANRFTPSQWMTSSGKYGGKGMSDRLPPMERRATRAVDDIAKGKDRGGLARSTAVANAAAARKAARRNTQKRARDLTKSAREENAALKMEEKTGSLPMAREAAKKLNEKLMPRKVSPLSDFLMADTAGRAIPVPTKSRVGSAARGVGVGRMIGSDATQDFLAGQTEWQRALAKALRENKMEEYTRLLSRQAAMSGTGE